MPRRLPKTDVVIVGLAQQAASPALPLTSAGLKVVGLEAGGLVGHTGFCSG